MANGPHPHRTRAPKPELDLLVHAARIAEVHNLDPAEVLRTLVDLALIRRGMVRRWRKRHAAAPWN